jgi:O-antigen/teichoic acid export membrane protein
MNNLKSMAIRGGGARLCAQGAGFVVRLGSVMVLSRLLEPSEFGLVGMATAFTGILMLFRDFGLSTATVQRATVSDEQLSCLFWINVLVGTILTLLTVALAPFVVAFYHDSRLFWITALLGTGFLANALGVQHSAILERHMRFVTLAVIEIVALVTSTLLAMLVARAGFRYWALVVMSISLPVASSLGMWLTAGWVPGPPRMGSGIRQMMRFGGTITLNGLVLYVAFNLDKVILGRYWGPSAIGIYGRAYQLIRIPTDNLNSAVGGIAMAALSRIQDDPGRMKRYFLKGYALVIAFTLPITMVCGLFADDMIVVLLGPKWKDGASILTLLACHMVPRAWH